MTPPGAGVDPRRAVEAELLAWMAEDRFTPDRDRFERLALALFRVQFEHCEPYRRFCLARGRSPENVAASQEIPAVPTGAFKEVALRGFPAEATVRTFRTSGTTRGRPGELHLDTTALYDASLRPSFRRFLLPDLLPGERMPIRVLAPPEEEAPHSSLTYMFARALETFGDRGSGFDLREGRLDLEGLEAAVEDARRTPGPLLLCGTSFAFVQLLDALAARGRGLPLPPGSRLMETGGYKGRSRTLAPEALRRELAEALDVPEERIVNQYGMTELGSQFHDSVLRYPGSPRRKLGPPWARVLARDPRSGAVLPPGEVGVLEIIDLANTGSVCAIETADLGRVLPGEPFGGFEVLGREPGAEERGCSLAAELMLGGGAER